jgi:dimethylhistidine N-methyltransferase
VSASTTTIATDSIFLKDVLCGLGQPNKQLPCKYFYDQRGSQLFDQICELDEYYLTRTEQAIMDEYADEMADQIDTGVMLVEFGSGSSQKTQVLLEHLHEPAAYVPVDISEKHLLQTAKDLRIQFPHIEILPVVADFTKPFSLPKSKSPPSHIAVYFPGSTIGNFEPLAAQTLLSYIANRLGPGGGLLIGIDLKKDPTVIEAAYNDELGVTAEFNLNLLHRINQELDADFDLEQFEHLARYNENAGRVEIFLVSTHDQSVTINDQTFSFNVGEKIFTEHSHKYSIEEFESLARPSGFSLHQHWTDDQHRFAVLHLVQDD